MTITPPAPSMLTAVERALAQPVHVQRVQLAMDEHNKVARGKALAKLLAERDYAEGRRLLPMYAVQVWRGLALRHSLGDALSYL